MPIPVTCPHCKEAYKLREAMIGKRVRCQECGDTFLVKTGREEDSSFEEKEFRSRRRPASRERSERGSHRTSRKYDDDYDDYDDDDYDDRPKKKDKTLFLVLVCAIGGIVLLGGIVGAIVYFKDSPEPTNDATVNVDAVDNQGGGVEQPKDDMEQRLRAAMEQEKNTPPVDMNDAVHTIMARKPNAGAAMRWIQKQPVDELYRLRVSRALAEFLKAGGNQADRSHALSTLGTWAHPDSEPVLKEILAKGESEQEMSFAMRALGTIRNEKTLPIVAEYLTKPEYRMQASAALQRWGALAIPEVTKYAEHDDQEVRETAERLLVHLKREAGSDLTQALNDIKHISPEVRKRGFETLINIEPDEQRRPIYSKALLTGFTDISLGDRKLAVDALANWLAVEHIPELVAKVRDPRSLSANRDLAKALVQSKHPQAYEAAVALLAETRIRYHVQAALEQADREAELPVIKGMLASPDRSIRTSCVSILKKIGGQKSFEALQVLAAQDPASRFSATVAAREIFARLQREAMMK